MSETTGSTPSESISSISPRVSDAALGTKIVERIRRDMRDSWRQDDELTEKFFPMPTTPVLKSKIAEALKRNYNSSRHRWKKAPEAPKTASALFTPLRMLMNDIILTPADDDSSRKAKLTRRNAASSRMKASQRKKILRQPADAQHKLSQSRRNEDPRRKKDPRRIFATHAYKKGVRSLPSSPVSPTLFLAGAGSEFASANATVETPEATTPSGISPIEIVLESDDISNARNRLAANMYQMFYNQANRRFAFGLILSETTCTIYMFDHSGAVASRPFNYHKEPARFCAVICGLATTQAECAGFDSSIFASSQGPQIQTWESLEPGGKSQKKVYYKILRGLFQPPTLVGRGTICWLTSKVDDPERTFVIKDAWIAPEELAGRESEGSLLRHVQSKGIMTGVAQLHHFEEVRRGEDSQDFDTVLRNRQVPCPNSDEVKLDRVHTRLVMKTHGKTLDHFRTRRELLLGFYDAVVAHRKLHDIADILHRDISVHNILINPDGVEGDRGILIDFDHAIRTGDTSPYSTKTKIGTWRFMSRNVIEGEGLHTYIDDLESFYFVLCWILVAFAGPGKAKVVIPKLVSFWDEPDAANLKRGHFGQKDFKLPIDPWFGPSLRNLAIHLFRFFQVRRFNLGQPLSALNPDKDYEEFLGYIKQCIEDQLVEGAPAD